VNLMELPSPEAVARAAADRLARTVEEDPAVVLGLPTGRTMIPFYAELARRHQRGEIDLSRARGFNIDELLLPPGHPASFRSFMERHAWERIGLPRERCDIPDAAAALAGGLEEECRRYDRALETAGGLGLLFLGIGADGHVAYNLPGPPRGRTHVVEVPAVVADTLPGPGVPEALRTLRAITVGFDALRSARRIVLLATTAEKAPALRALLEGPEDPTWPCTHLRDHPRFDVLVTPEALRGRDENAVESTLHLVQIVN
jgi:glucosamine-6-phosphate deaminase